jgi:predicted helicase
MFRGHVQGLLTGRDSWAYNDSAAELRTNVSKTIGAYNEQVATGLRSMDPTKVSWTDSLKSLFDKGALIEESSEETRTCAYRPFNKRHLTGVRQLIHRPAILKRYFPDPTVENHGFYVVGGGNDKPFSVLAVSEIPDLSFWGSGQGQFFPRYSYSTPSSVDSDVLFTAAGPARLDNITDTGLTEYREAYGAAVTKDDLYFYAYGLLHSPEYRERFAADLKKLLPRIPQVSGADRFRAFAEAGKELSDLHIGYEGLEPYPLSEVAAGLTVEQDDYARYAVTKMKYAGKAGAWDKTRIIYNEHITLEGIPEDAQDYVLGSRSAIDWIIERYQIKTDKNSGIVNDPNAWSREHEQPRYIIDLIGRIVALSLQTNRIVDALPELELL